MKKKNLWGFWSCIWIFEIQKKNYFYNLHERSAIGCLKRKTKLKNSPIFYFSSYGHFSVFCYSKSVHVPKKIYIFWSKFLKFGRKMWNMLNKTKENEKNAPILIFWVMVILVLFLFSVISFAYRRPKVKKGKLRMILKVAIHKASHYHYAVCFIHMGGAAKDVRTSLCNFSVKSWFSCVTVLPYLDPFLALLQLRICGAPPPPPSPPLPSEEVNVVNIFCIRFRTF